MARAGLRRSNRFLWHVAVTARQACTGLAWSAPSILSAIVPSVTVSYPLRQGVRGSAGRKQYRAGVRTSEHAGIQV